MKSNHSSSQTIISHEIFKNKKTLVIFLPAAGTEYNDFKNFIDKIKKFTDVIYVNQGYFGLRMNYHFYEEYQTQNFVKKFYEKFNKTIATYDNVVLIGQSMGAIEAVPLHGLIPNSKLVLISPPVTEKKSKGYRILEAVLFIFIGNRMTRKITQGLEKIEIYSLGKYIPKNVIKDIVKTIKKAGLMSWLSCLAELTKLGVFKNMKIPDDAIIIIGKNDTFLSKLVQKKMRIRPNTFIINSKHGLLQQCPFYVFEHIIKKILL